MNARTLLTFQKMKENGEKIATLTAYDATTAKLLDEQGIEIFLVGDSLGQVIQGHAHTVSTTIEAVEYHTRCVAQGTTNALLMSDMPFATYECGQSAFLNAAKLIRAGAAMVKMEGKRWLAPIITKLLEQGIPVCAHLGLGSQSVHAIGGYRVQGKTLTSRQELIDDAMSLVEAGASMLLIECVPQDVAADIAKMATVPVIGIGAGSGVDGQILVIYDLLGMTDFKSKFVRNFLSDSASVGEAVSKYKHAVKQGTFPSIAESYG